MKAKLIAGVLLLPVWSGAAVAHQFIPPAIVARVPPPAPGLAIRLKQPSVIALGRKLFEKETFGGNGRTCATCHARRENFSLSPANVAARPSTDPLFVFKRIPGLLPLENETAMRQRALILENLDGFDKPGVLRGSMGIAGLALTTTPAPSISPLVAGLGWSGDGSPGDGSIRNFAVGAIVQHFTKSLQRRLDVDFRMPTSAELDALDAFQMSLGRRTTPITDPNEDGHLVFRDANVTQGQVLFHGMPSRNGGTRRCSGCHRGGGALTDPPVVNDQVANGTELTSAAPSCFFTAAPGDGGFLATPALTRDRSTYCPREADDGDGDLPFPVGPLQTGDVPFLGDQKFNVQSIIEAAGTAPFFHDNSAATLEQAVGFYDSDVFNDSPKGAGNGFIIPPLNRNQIAAFLRALNVLDAIGNAKAILATTVPTRVADARQIVLSAVRVLGQGNIRIYSDARLKLSQAAGSLGASTGTQAARLRLDEARLLILGG